MITKGEILALPNSKTNNKFIVKIYIFNTAGIPEYIRLNASKQEATLCYPSGLYNNYKVGDKVVVGFENNQMSSPIILGKFYETVDEDGSLIPKEFAGYHLLQSLEVSNTATLPLSTIFKDNEDEISATEILTHVREIANLKNQVKQKQDLLVSGENLKTINNISLLGAGNIDISLDSYLPLSGGTLTGKLTLANRDDSLVLPNNSMIKTSISDGTTDTLRTIYGYNATTDQLIVGSPYATLLLRGENTRPRYNSDSVSLALYSDIPTSVNGMTGGAISSSVSINGGLTISSGTPLLLTGYGSGTYNKGAFVCNTTDKFGVECPRETDSSTANIVPFRIGARGGQLGNLEVGNISATSVKVNNVNVALSTDLSTKQDTLVSGTNIKTLNGVPILGSGNLNISGTIAAPTLIGYTTSSSNRFLFTGIDLTSQKGVGLFTFGNCFTFINLYGLQSGVNYKFPGSFIYNSNGNVITTTVNVIWYSETNTLWISSGNGNYSMINGYTGYLYLITLP